MATLFNRKTCPKCDEESRDILRLIRNSFDAHGKLTLQFTSLVAKAIAGADPHEAVTELAGKLYERLATAIDDSSSVVVPPAHVLVQLRGLMFKTCLFSGNKRYDDMDQSAQLGAEVAKTRVMSAVPLKSSGGYCYNLDDDENKCCVQ
jgi:hypothetical protein